MKFKNQYEHTLTKEYLEREYTQKKRKIKELADEISCATHTIYRYLKFHGIKQEDKRGTIEPGQTFNRLTTIKVVDKRKNGALIWLCKCDCGKLSKVDTGSLKCGKVKSCGCIMFQMVTTKKGKIKKEWSYKDRNYKHGSKHHLWKGCGDISGNKWLQIKISAKNRKILFNITIEEMWDLFEKQKHRCILSNLYLRFEKNNNTASLDRIDSFKGYTLNNIQWVHKDINTIKASLSQIEFINLCKLITDPQINQLPTINNPTIYSGFWADIKYNAKKRKIKFELSKDETLEQFSKQNELCAITKQSISLPTTCKEYRSRIHTASLDRINNNDGYNINNIQWVHKIVNQSRKDLNIDYYKHLCNLVVQHNLDKENKK